MYMYIACTYMSMIVCNLVNIYIHVCTMFRHVCTVLPNLVQVIRMIPDVCKTVHISYTDIYRSLGIHRCIMFMMTVHTNLKPPIFIGGRGQVSRCWAHWQRRLTATAPAVLVLVLRPLPWLLALVLLRDAAGGAGRSGPGPPPRRRRVPAEHRGRCAQAASAPTRTVRDRLSLGVRLG